MDGIDVNASTATNVEYGYLIRNLTTTNGSQHNTIKNMTITLNNSSTSALYAIFQTTNTSGGGVALRLCQRCE